MHTFLSSTNVKFVDNVIRITFTSPMGDYIFDADEVLTQDLIDKLINGMYFDKMPDNSKDQLSFVWSEENE